MVKGKNIGFTRVSRRMRYSDFLGSERRPCNAAGGEFRESGHHRKANPMCMRRRPMAGINRGIKVGLPFLRATRTLPQAS